jgi:hypothetical protein
MLKNLEAVNFGRFCETSCIKICNSLLSHVRSTSAKFSLSRSCKMSPQSFKMASHENTTCNITLCGTKLKRFRPLDNSTHPHYHDYSDLGQVEQNKKPRGVISRNVLTLDNTIQVDDALQGRKQYI